jgi:hypothetical protein
MHFPPNEQYISLFNTFILKQKTKQNGTIQFKLVQKPETKAIR